MTTATPAPPTDSPTDLTESNSALVEALSAEAGEGAGESCASVPSALRPEFDDIRSGVLKGIAAEMASVRAELARWGGDKEFLVPYGNLIEQTGDEFIYELTLADVVRPPPFTGVDICIGSVTIQGMVEEALNGGRSLLVSTEDRLPSDGRGATLNFNATWVLENLYARISALPEDGAHANLPRLLRTLGLTEPALGAQPLRHPSHKRRGLNAGQMDAISRAVGSNLLLVLGPPGTGKTRTLGGLVAELASTHGRRTAVLAHTNVALDTALQSTIDALGPELVSEGRVIRLGRHCKEFRHLRLTMKDAEKKASGGTDRALEDELAAMLRELDAILPQARSVVVRMRRSQINSRDMSLESRVRHMLARIMAAPADNPFAGKLGMMRDRLLQIQEAGASKSSSLLRNAMVVGATLSKLAMSMGDFDGIDTVVIDEASMASLPFGIVASLVASKAVIIFGDPKQLPPIVQSRDHYAVKWLGRDLFAQLGATDTAKDDPRRPILLEQYRMAPSIRAMVSRLFYADRLVDAEAILKRAPRSGPSLFLVDTSDTDAVGEQISSSWQNVRHADIVADIAESLSMAGEPEIGIIAPFNPQQRLIKGIIDERIPYFRRAGGFIRTIHRSQGGEQDTIILDLTVAGRMSSFLDERSPIGKALAQLLCVALSRARHRLIIVAHTATFRRHFGSRGLMMYLLATAHKEGRYLRLPASGEISMRDEILGQRSLLDSRSK